MWFLTVFGLMCSSAAIIALSLPFAISLRTSISRSDSSPRIASSMSGLADVERTPTTTLAALSYAGGAPLVWTTSLGEGVAQMSGTADTEARAIFDVRRGRLNQATSSTSGSFDVRVAPQGEQGPLSGRLNLELDLRLRRLGWRPGESRTPPR